MGDVGTTENDSPLQRRNWSPEFADGAGQPQSMVPQTVRNARCREPQGQFMNCPSWRRNHSNGQSRPCQTPLRFRLRLCGG